MRWAARLLAIVAVVMGGMAVLGFMGSGGTSNMFLFGAAPALIMLYSAATAWQGDAQRALLHPTVQALVVVWGTFYGYQAGVGIATLHGNLAGALQTLEAGITAMVFLVAIVLPYRAPSTRRWPRAQASSSRTASGRL